MAVVVICVLAIPATAACGKTSWYGPGFYGNRTASGEVFNKTDLTAAHRTLPFGTWIVVTNQNNGKSVRVKINDRGPFHRNRILDLSSAAADAIGMKPKGVVPICYKES